MVLFFVILPIVFRVVDEKSKVMKGLAYVKKSEIEDILSWASAFDVRSSAKSLKLLSETRKDKVYEIMMLEKEKHNSTAKKEETKVSTTDNKTEKLRDLIRNIFKFDDEDGQQEEKKDDYVECLDNSIPSGFGAGASADRRLDFDSPSPVLAAAGGGGGQSAELISKEAKTPAAPQNKEESMVEPILAGEEKNESATPNGEMSIDEKVYLQRKKQSLAQTEYPSL